ncbi:dihydroxyacetone kinase subunit L [Mycoplasmopsis agassizii]|uniref:Dihydroxyacetone kinase subunit L n=1 Tax=Mycoplasmopsis agassizii TaxID=33922 RepID=A0A269TJG8_9BACT|nr:dihydroxyacetone kinase subunit DhaL [Mycoplasmopsis agassizii]PAK21632.1 dihydroxyacetone kinase subunit L [Mycoplasmopsis agassizii]
MINNHKLVEIFKTIAREISLRKNELTELDRLIGDSDHGTNMDRGFSNVLSEIDNYKDKDLSEIFTFVGKSLMAKIGGASGPLYGMVFVRSASIFKDQPVLNQELFQRFLTSAVASLQTYGQANYLDKTMLDVWIPLTKEYQHNKNKMDLIKQIDEYVMATKVRQALKGRASYLKERSIGVIDPGSLSSSIILKEFIKEI